MPLLCALAVLLLLAGLPAGGAQPLEPAVPRAAKPPAPPGRDPGGLAVALFARGVDYTHPELAPRLARDGEGELIGWDFVDGDRRPYAPARSEAYPALDDATALAIAIAAGEHRIVPLRVDPRRPESLGRAVAFTALTPARLVAVPLAGVTAADWQFFARAAERSPHLLFFIPAGDEGKDLDREPRYPAALKLANALVVTPARTAVPLELQPGANWGARSVDCAVLASATHQALAIAIAAAARLAATRGLSGAELKAALLAGATARQSRDGATPSQAPVRTRFSAVLTP